MDAELMADRRRLRRKLSFWRVLGVLALLIAVITAGAMLADRSGLPGLPGKQIARVSVGGFITGNQRTSDLLKRVGEADDVSGVVIAINSPGGTTSGADELYQNIRQLAAKKPLVAFVDGTAASGGYITAIAADHIVARETALVGSIGVIFQYPEVSELLDKLGVKVEDIKSTPLKAEPSGVRPTSPEARQALQEVVNENYEWFKRLVKQRRRLSDTELAAASTGQIFGGRGGLRLRLVDQLGSERDAIAWLEREKGVAKDLPVRDWRPRGDSTLSLWSLAAVGADLVGLESAAERLRRVATNAGAVQLDGLLAVWHPAAEK
jgi:protease IV